MPIVDQMSKGETPTHARLGISVSPVASQDGAEVVRGRRRSRRSATARPPPTPASPKGDIITKVDDQLITDADSLVATIRSYRPGDEVTVTYTHDGDTQDHDAHARLGRRHVQVLTPTRRPSCARDAEGPGPHRRAGPSPSPPVGPHSRRQALLELPQPGDGDEAEPLVDADHVAR